MFCVVWNKIEKSLIKTDILEKMRRGSRYFVERKNCQSLWLITLENSTTDFCFSDRFSVYFNGCVYNKEELQKLLPNSKDCSIAHIINQLYQIYGTFLFEKINGLFVVIIIDTLKRNVLIARDRFGWKSIYYHISKNKILISDDFLLLKCTIPYQRLSLDAEAISSIIGCRFVPWYKTIFQQIHKVEPAEFISFMLDSWKLKKHKYWTPSIIWAEFSQKEFDTKYLTMIQTIKNAVSDISILLSWGVDSAAVFLALNRCSQKNHLAYTAVFEEVENKEWNHNSTFSETACDESNKAFQIVSYYNGIYHKLLLNTEISWKTFDDLQKVLWEPICVSNALWLYLLSKKLINPSKALMSGTGADELLGGYEALYFWKKKELSQDSSMFDLFESFSDFDNSDYDLYSLLKNKFINKSYIKSFLNQIANINTKKISTLNQITLFELSFGLLNRELMMADKIFANIGAVAIPGFLENDFLDYCLSIPDTDKKNKNPLRGFMMGKIPQEIVKQPKIPSLSTPLVFKNSKMFQEKIRNLRDNPFFIRNKRKIKVFIKKCYDESSFDILYRIVYLDSRLKANYKKYEHIPVIY